MPFELLILVWKELPSPSVFEAQSGWAWKIVAEFLGLVTTCLWPSLPRIPAIMYFLRPDTFS